MQISVANQVYVLTAMIILGGAVGVLFDIFRIFRRMVHPGVALTGLTDMLFWLMTAIGSFLLVLIVNGGVLRWFEALGVILGATIYFLTLSHVFMAVICTICGFICKIFFLIFKILLTPLIFLYKMIKRSVLWIGKIILKPFGALHKIFKRYFAHTAQKFKSFKTALKKT